MQPIACNQLTHNRMPPAQTGILRYFPFGPG